MNLSSPIRYARESGLDVVEYRHILVDSGLGSIRPVDDLDRLKLMVEQANLIVTARRDGPGGELLGVARCLTDFCWVCYLSDLAVSQAAQGLGIGKGLIEATRAELGPEVSLGLVSVPEAIGFYERIGMARELNGFWLKRAR